MIKKIGCVIAYTPNQNNYGTSLQSYATIKKIKDLGYQPEVIRYKKHLSVFEKVKLVINMFRSGGYADKILVIKHKINNRKNKKYAENIAIRTNAVNAYKEKYLVPFFEEYDGYESLCKGSINYDVVLVGSDQLWTPLGLYSKYYNLLFVDDVVRKVAYAASFGVHVIPNFQKKSTGEYLNRFYKIGIRELRGKEIVEMLSVKTAQVVADPTLLLSKEEWEKEITRHVLELKQSDNDLLNGEPYIFCYFLGVNQEARRAANELKQQTALKIITIRHMDEYVSSDEAFGDEAPYNVDPNDFVRYISRAEYVCTDSFHCSVFSIIFQRKFMAFYRFAVASKFSRNSRIDSLFNVLGISREHIFDGDIMKIDNSVDWKIVGNNLAELRRSSLQFLKDSLE